MFVFHSNELAPTGYRYLNFRFDKDSHRFSQSLCSL